jgi:hypothetical protein
MKIAIRLALLAAVAGVGFWLWTGLFPSPEKVVLGKIASLAATATFSANDSKISRAIKVGNLIGYFAVEAEINTGSRTLSGRDEIRDVLRAVFNGLNSLKVEFLDATVRLSADRMTADVSCTANVHTGDSKDFGVQEMHFQLKMVEGNWLITCAETVKTLK